MYTQTHARAAGALALADAHGHAHAHGGRPCAALVPRAPLASRPDPGAPWQRRCHYLVWIGTDRAVVRAAGAAPRHAGLGDPEAGARHAGRGGLPGLARLLAAALADLAGRIRAAGRDPAAFRLALAARPAALAALAGPPDPRLAGALAALAAFGGWEPAEPPDIRDALAALAGPHLPTCADLALLLRGVAPGAGPDAVPGRPCPAALAPLLAALAAGPFGALLADPGVRGALADLAGTARARAKTPPSPLGAARAAARDLLAREDAATQDAATRDTRARGARAA